MRGFLVIAGVSLGVFALGACNTPRERLPDGSMAIQTADAGGSAGAGGGSAGAAGSTVDGGAGGTGGGAGGSGGMPVVLTPANLALDPLSKDLSTIVIGHYAEATFQISNTGQAATSLPAVSLDGTDATQYAMTSNTCNAPIDGGKSCLITVRFTPTTAGLKTAQLSISATMGGALTAMLQGTGITQGALTIDPPNQSLGSVLKGQAGTPSTFTVTNTGGSVTGMLSTTISDSTEIAIATDGCKGMTLAAGAKCTITVALTTMTAGQKSATLTVTGSPGGTTSASLTGVGLAPASLAVTPPTAAFGDTVVGTTSAPQIFTITNSGGVVAGTTTALAPVLAVATGTAAAEFAIASNNCTATLGAGASCSVGVTFKPGSAAANKGATLTASAVPGGMGSASMTGNGLVAAALTLSPATGAAPDFGTIVTNTAVSQTYVVSNTGQQATSVVTIATTGTDFTVVTPGAGDCTGSSPLAGGASCAVHVKFAPTTTGAKTSTLSASATTGGAQMLSLTGVAVAPGALMLAPASRSFGSLLQNTSSAPGSFTVTNTGGTATSALTTAISGSSEFGIATDGCKAMTLAGGAQCTITVTFSPTSGGQKTGTLTVSAATGGTTASSLTGTGLTPAVLTVSPTIFTFPPGTVSGTTSAAQSFTVTNTGGVASSTVSATIGGTDASQFSVASSTCTTVAAGATCTIGVTFKPTTAGTKAGALNVSATSGGSASATLGATSLAPAKLTLLPASGSSNDFGSILVGNTMLETFVVANGGEQAASTPLTITVSGTDFSVATPSANGDCASSTLLAPSASCVVRVQFKPTAAVVRTGAVSVSAATGGTATLSPAPTGVGVNPSAVSIMPLTQTFGSVQQGTPSASHTFTVTNTGGVTTGTIATSVTPTTDFAITADNCKGKMLVVSGTCTITVVMTPAAVGARNGTLTLSDAASGSSSSAALSGTGLSTADLTISPATFTFPAGTASNTTSTPQTFTISNQGGVVSGTITAMIAGTDSTQFSVSSNNCTTLGPGLTCAIGVAFKPTSTGAKAATLSLAASPGGSPSATLAGTAVAPAVLAIAPASQAFGSVAQGSPSPGQSFTVTNSGGATTGALATAITGSTEFAITTDNCKGKTLAAAGTCTLTVVLTPVAPVGAKMATLMVSGSPGGSPTSSLTGSSFTPAVLALSPTTSNFGSVAVGTTKDLLVTLSNSGTQAAAGIARTVTGSGFSLPAPTGTECGTTLNGSNATCSIRVRFTPPGLAGTVIGTLAVTATTGSAPPPASLTANAYGILAIPFASDLRIASLGGMDGAGKAVVGRLQNAADTFGFYWAVGAATVTTIPPVPGDTTSSDARAISSNGLVVTGVASSSKIWTWSPGATSARDLSFVFPSKSAHPLGINNTGTVIVGDVFDGQTGLNQGFVWRAALSGFEFLGDLVTQSIVANSVSDNGRIVGTLSPVSGAAVVGITWTTSGNVTQQPGTMLPGNTTGASAISGDGNVIVGSDVNGAAIKWTTFTAQPQPLAAVPGASQTAASGVNQNGTVIVGTAVIANQVAIAWTPAAVDIAAALAGAPNIGLFSLESAKAVSADGKTIAGDGSFNGIREPWVARLP
jgi:hypothetical protein